MNAPARTARTARTARARRRRPLLGATTAAAVLVLTPTACGGGGGGAASDGASSSSPSAAEAAAASGAPTTGGDVVPDGSYSKIATLAEAQGLGMSDTDARRMLGPGGQTTYTLSFDGERWAEFGDAGSGPELGDVGSLTYDADGDLVTTSESDGCPGCRYTYDWTLDGEALTLTIIDHDSPDTPAELLETRLVTEGTYRSDG